MSSFIQGYNWAVDCASKYEQMWREDSKDLPQCRLISRPVYKFVASHSNTTFATAASFVMTDLIVHQLMGGAAICVMNNVLSNPTPCKISWRPGWSLVWASLALPIMFAKYNKSSKQ